MALFKAMQAKFPCVRARPEVREEICEARGSLFEEINKVLFISIEMTKGTRGRVSAMGAVNPTVECDQQVSASKQPHFVRGLEGVVRVIEPSFKEGLQVLDVGPEDITFLAAVKVRDFEGARHRDGVRRGDDCRHGQGVQEEGGRMGSEAMSGGVGAKSWAMGASREEGEDNGLSKAESRNDVVDYGRERPTRGVTEGCSIPRWWWLKGKKPVSIGIIDCPMVLAC